MTQYDLKTVQAMQNAGLVAEVSFGGGFCVPTRVELTPEQVILYLDQGLDYVMRLTGAEPEEYEEWQACHGKALCMETLKSGKPCGNQVASECSIDEWKRLHRNEYCKTHS
jgi:hypothetical protein